MYSFSFTLNGNINCLMEGTQSVVHGYRKEPQERKSNVFVFDK
jgi:hypothetical protein